MYKRAKIWVRNHQDELVLAGVGTAIIGLFVVVVRYDMKQREQINAEFEDRIDDLNVWYDTEKANKIHELAMNMEQAA